MLKLNFNHWLRELRLWLQVMRLNQPIGIFLLLAPTYWALCLASDKAPQFAALLFFGTAVIITRSLGCVINDFWDRDIDCYVSRTKSRPLTSGSLSLASCFWLIALLACLAIILACFTPLQLTRPWLLLAGLLLIIYPTTKRFCKYPQLFLACAFSCSIPIVFLTLKQHLTVASWLLMLINLQWTLAYDTLYAMVDQDDDKLLAIHSTALSFGEYSWSICLSIYLLLLIEWLTWGCYANYSKLFFACIITGFASYLAVLLQAAQFGKPEACFAAFKANAKLGASICLALLLR